MFTHKKTKLHILISVNNNCVHCQTVNDIQILQQSSQNMVTIYIFLTEYGLLLSYRKYQSSISFISDSSVYQYTPFVYL